MLQYIWYVTGILLLVIIINKNKFSFFLSLNYKGFNDLPVALVARNFSI